MKRMTVAALLILVLLSLCLVSESSAIPAFARRYKISCNTCHSPFPRLKPYGDEFAGNGFIIKEDEKERDYISAGDEMLWLNKDFPIAVRFDAYAVYDQNDDQQVKKDIESIYGLKLLSGGTVYKNVGYYFYFFMNERGEIAGVEDAYLHFDNLFGTPLDLLVGQFQTCDPLMKRELRLTFEDYAIYGARFGNSVTNLTYDRGVILTYGIEKTGTDLLATIVNGNGIGESGDDEKFDSDDYKNYGLRVKQGIGEMLSIGAFYYRGKERQSDIDNKITYIGPDVNITAGPFQFTGQYLERKDSNALFAPGTAELKSKGMVAELVFSPQLDRSRYYITGLYNKIDSDDYKYETATISGTYQLARNLRIMAEYTRDLQHDFNRVTMGLVSGF
ncbi:hypothetical protein JW960_20645 [candidate division KSB1 bacterium]|nr:hypothetical protein [candidate division KSB1 bacterium]